MTWLDLGSLEALPQRGARVVRAGNTCIAVFRTSTGKVFALRDRCPHRGGPLSQGIVYGERVTCPLHDWVIDLATGRATGVDEGATDTYNVRVIAGSVMLELPDGLGAAPTARPAESPAVQTDARACALFERA